MLVVRGVVRAGRQHSDRRRLLALGPDAAQVLEQHVRIVLHRADRARGEQLREQPHHHPAILEHVGHAGRYAQVVLQHVVLARTRAHQVHAGDVRVDPAGHVHAGHFPPVLRVAQHSLRRNGAGLQDLLVVIDVREKQVERAHALLQPGLQHAPFVRGNDARHDVEWNQSLRSGVFAIHRERDSDTVERAFGLVPFLCNAGAVGTFEPVGECPVMGPDYASRDGHFVKREGGHAIVSGVSEPAKQAVSHSVKGQGFQRVRENWPGGCHRCFMHSAGACTRMVRHCP